MTRKTITMIGATAALALAAAIGVTSAASAQGRGYYGNGGYYSYNSSPYWAPSSRYYSSPYYGYYGGYGYSERYYGTRAGMNAGP